MADDTNLRRDVFVHDRETGITARVSLNSEEQEGNAASGDWERSELSMSEDGRYIAFRSFASNLVSNDTNGQTDVFVRDRLMGTTERVSVNSDGEEGNAESGRFGTAITPDGRYVVFESFATNLAGSDTNENSDIFLHDRQTGITEMVSVASSGVQGDDASSYPEISNNGRFITFSSVSRNIATPDQTTMDIFVHDRLMRLTLRLSETSTGIQASEESHFPDISGDGRLYAFSTISPGMTPEDVNGVADVFLRDLGESMPMAIPIRSMLALPRRTTPIRTAT